MTAQRFLRFALTLTLTGCAADDLEELDEVAEEQLEINGDPLNGNPANTLSGVVQIQVPGDSRVRTGLLIETDLVLTSSRWVTTSTPAAQIQVTHGTAGVGQVRSGWVVTINPYLPIAVIQTTQPFTGNVMLFPIDQRQPGALVNQGAALSCFAYRTSTDFRRAQQEVRRQDGAREVILGPPFGTSLRLDDWDAGAPCIDSAAQTWVGFALSATGAPTNESRIFVAKTIDFFIDGMRIVARLRRTQPLADMLYTNGPGGERMCLDVPYGSPYRHAGLNQYPCHGGPNQRWFYHYTNSYGPSFINAVTGSCIDVPGGSTTSGQALQMFPCHGGLNQSWQNNGLGSLAPGSAPITWPSMRRTLCMSVRGGRSATSQPIEQATCVSGAAHQQWFQAVQ